MCSGLIPHHKCCSIYVICRVQIAFHTTRLHIALNVFSSPIIPSHNSKRFYFTPTFTSHHSPPHHSTSYHHCTSFSHHPTTYHIPRHISQTFNVTTRLASDHHILHYDITRQSASHHYFTPPHLEDRTTYCTSHGHSPHLTPFHIHHFKKKEI